MKFIVGSQNKAKVKAVEQVVNKIFPCADGEAHVVIGVSVPSGVSDQPKTAEETMNGAINRAKAALKTHDDADYGIGLEGGLEKHGELYFECGWAAVAERTKKTSDEAASEEKDKAEGKLGIGSSARFQVSNKVVAELMRGRELADVVDELSGLNDVRSSQGMMGMITNGHLPRDECYAQGLIFAFAPFISPPQYWD